MPKKLSHVFIFLLSFTILTFSGCSMTDVSSDAEMLPQEEPAINSTPITAINQPAPSLGWSLDFTSPRGLFGVWGTSTSEVFAVGGTSGTETIVMYDGTSWTTQIDGVFSLREFGDVWGFASDDVFAVGGQFPGSVAHYDGTSWTIQYTGATLDGFVGVWGSSPTDVFASGTNSGTGHGIVIHYDGIQWTTSFETTNAGENFRSIWGFGPNNVYVVGAGGTILNYDGTTWTQQVSGTTAFLEDVWGASPTDIFAVGGTTVLHFDGTSWSALPSPPSLSLKTVWGFGPDDVFVGGDSGVNGEIHHYDGTTWTTLPTVSTQPITELWGPSRTELFAVAQFGHIYRSVSLSTTITVEVDIKPGSNTNPINLKSKGKIPVAILSSSTFDATTIDPFSVLFGPDGATHAHNAGHIEDVDGDGMDDLVLHFKTQQTGISAGDTEACLTGQTFSGDDIEGCDTITIVGS